MKRTFLFRLCVALVAICVPAGFLGAQVPVQDTVQPMQLSAASGSDPATLPAGIFNRSLLTPSPDGCALMRSIQLPVDKYTGIANISVPITRIEAGGKTIPVALNYQASGIKVQDVASCVGLGWRLAAGGRITRAVRGWADNLDDFSSRTAMLDDRKWTRQTFEERMRTRFDTEPDLFYFEYPGGGGMFLFDQGGKPVTIPGQNIRILYADGQFRLTDIDGTEYLYTTSESTDYSVEGEKNREEYVSTWFLNHIRYADGSLVTFGYEATEAYVYTNYAHQTEMYHTASVTYDASHQIAQPEERVTFGGNYSKNVRITVRNPKQLSWIRYKDYRIDFSYETGRTDMPGMRKLTEISVSHPLGGKRRYELSYGAFANKSLKLLGVKDVSLTGKGLDICAFEYYEELNLPERSSYTMDQWGYYNGQYHWISNPETDIVSRVTGKPVHVEGLSKSPSLPHARANSIRLIRYAAGGTKEFQYELHSGRNPATGKMQETGGLRIGKILEKASSAATPSEYTYTYSGGVVYADSVNYCCYVRGTSAPGAAKQTASYYLSSQPVNEVPGVNNCPVVYASVTEHLPNGAYTVYEYVPYEEIHDSDPVLYEVENGLVARGREKERVTPRSSRLWMRNLLQSETQYDVDGSRVQRTAYSYVKGEYTRIHGYNCYTEQPGGTTIPRYYVAKYYWDTQSVAVSKIETAKGRCNLGSTLTSRYDPATLLPTEIEKADNDGNTTRTTITYPSDYSTEVVADEYVKGIKTLKYSEMRSDPHRDRRVEKRPGGRCRP